MQSCNITGDCSWQFLDLSYFWNRICFFAGKYLDRHITTKYNKKMILQTTIINLNLVFKIEPNKDRKIKKWFVAHSTFNSFKWNVAMSAKLLLANGKKSEMKFFTFSLIKKILFHLSVVACRAEQMWRKVRNWKVRQKSMIKRSTKKSKRIWMAELPFSFFWYYTEVDFCKKNFYPKCIKVR